MLGERQPSKLFNSQEKKHHGELETRLWNPNQLRQGCHLPNDTEGRTRNTVTFSRLYKDGEQWNTTQTFGRNDLFVMAKVADQTHPRIFEIQQGGDA